MTPSPQTAAERDAAFEVLAESILFLVRHVKVPNLADAFIADLHRTAAGNEAKLKIVDDLAYRLRERDEFIAENDS